MKNTQAINVKAGSAVATGSVTVSDSMPGVPCPDPAGYKYVGARYVPLFAEPAEWNVNSTYEPLTIVLNEGNSYTSKQYVPVGVQIDNEEYWALTGNFNAQYEQVRTGLLAEQKYRKQGFVTLEEFGAAGDGSTDDTEKINQAVEYAEANSLSVVGYGVYGVSSTISVSGVDVEGVSLKYIGADQAGVYPVLSVQNSSLSNCQVNGNDKTVVGIKIGSNSSLRECLSDNCRYTGYLIEGNFIDLMGCASDSCTYKDVFVGGVYQVMSDSSFVRVVNCLATNNVGKGFSAINSSQVKFIGCKNDETPDNAFYAGHGANGVEFSDCSCVKTQPSSLNGSALKISRGARNVTVKGCDYTVGGTSGSSAVCGIYIDGGSNVFIDGCEISTTGVNGILVTNHPADSVDPATVSENVEIAHCKFNVTNSNVIRVSPLDTTISAYVKNVTIRDCMFTNTTITLYVQGAENVDIRSCTFDGAATNNVILLYEAGTCKTISNCVFTNCNVVPIRCFNTSGAVIEKCYFKDGGEWAGAATHELVTLANADNVWFINNVAEGGWVNGITQDADSENVFIAFNSLQTPSMVYILRNNGKGGAILGNVFKGTSISSNIYGSGMTIQFNSNINVSQNNSAPTDGTWQRGDRVYKTAPAAGENIGWVCTTAGTPGTWKTFGAIEA